jgi:uncharacterized membrane protein YtjA (UPF0391 family)
MLHWSLMFLIFALIAAASAASAGWRARLWESLKSCSSFFVVWLVAVLTRGRTV